MRTFLKKNVFPWIIRLAPWGVAIGVLYWLFTVYPIDNIQDAISLINPLYLLLLGALYAGFGWFMDSYGIAHTLSRFRGKHVTWQSILPARASSYLIGMINYAGGQGALAYAVKRGYGIPLPESLAIFLLLGVVDIFWAVTFVFIGSFFVDFHILGVDLVPTIRGLGYVTYAACIGHLIFWCMHWEDRIRGPRIQKIFAWMREKKLFRVFHEATLLDYTKIALLRVPIHLALVGCVYVVMTIFHAHVPLKIIFYKIMLPVLVGVIPISWGGVGTSNKALVDVLAPHTSLLPSAGTDLSPEQVLLALSLAWMGTNYLFKLIIGLLCLPKTKRQVVKT